MNLVIDIGNTQLKAAIFHKEELIEHIIVSVESLDKLSEMFSRYSIKRTVISNVRSIPQELETLLESISAISYDWNSSLKIPLDSNYATPETLGRDRICNAVAAKSKYPGKNVLVIDMGTCNKYDFVDAKGKYLGGAISPGFQMRFSSMHQFTDQLPYIETTVSNDFIGDSTQNSMKSGVYFGIIGEFKYYIEQYNKRFHDIEVILTGGFSTYFDKEVKNYIFADPYLTLRGLNIILNFQEE